MSDGNLLEMSLGEIIQRQRVTIKPKKLPVGKKKGATTGAGAKRNGVQTGRITKPAVRKGGAPIAKASPIVDARLKLIQKTRSKIGDARERLNQRLRQGDARSRITPKAQLRTRPALKGLPSARMDSLPRRTLDVPRSLADTGRYRTSAPPSRPVGSVSRTIRNGTARSILRGGTAYMDRERSPDRDPDWASRMHSLPRLEIHVPTVREREPLMHRTHMDLESNTWSRPMKSVPQVGYSRSSSRDYPVKSRLEPSRSQEGYRIVVSNLQPSVTHEDIKELFEDVGALMGSRVVRPGTAEVVYKSLEDAIAAVDTYHNRQLDGQPMKCLLVKSSHSTKGGKEILPDISTVHHALFTK